MRLFGSGVLIGKGSGSNPTPQKFGILQECQLDFSFTTKELYGSYQFPVDIGRGAAKISGKAKQGDINGVLLGSLFFNETVTTAQILLALQEAATIPATPFQVTVTNAANFLADEGVYYFLTGTQLTRVAAGPAAGQYSVNEATGVYTFAAADTTLALRIDYTYSAASGGSKFVIANNLLGDAPQFSVEFNGVRNGKQINVLLNRCISSKLTLATKLEDFTIPEFDFMAMADDSNNVGTISIAT